MSGDQNMKIHLSAQGADIVALLMNGRFKTT